MNNTWTAAERCFAVSSPTVEAVVVVLVTDLVEAHTLRVLHTDCWLTEVVAALITVRTVIIVNTACRNNQLSVRARLTSQLGLTSLALTGLTVGTVVRGVGGRDVTGPVRVLALRVLGAATGWAVGAGAVHVTVASTALVTVSVTLALCILWTGEDTVDDIGPVTHWTQGVLVRNIEGESPLTLAPGVLIQAVLAGSALYQAGLPLGATLPEPAAVWTQCQLGTDLETILLLECSW